MGRSAQKSGGAARREEAPFEKPFLKFPSLVCQIHPQKIISKIPVPCLLERLPHKTFRKFPPLACQTGPPKKNPKFAVRGRRNTVLFLFFGKTV